MVLGYKLMAVVVTYGMPAAVSKDKMFLSYNIGAQVVNVSVVAVKINDNGCRC